MTARRQNRPHSESVDDYLKAILAMEGPKDGRATSTALAERLGVAPASVTNMLQKLAALPTPLVEYERHHGVRLTETGKRRALEVLRHHRLIETFLYKVLDYPLEEIHEEAERLEHFISERFEERIAAKLGNPTIDPHGHSIPAMDGKMVKEISVLLTQVIGEGTFEVDSIADRDAATVKLLSTSGIAHGVRLRLRERHAEDVYAVSVGGSTQVLHLSREAADTIRVHPAQ
jgi:DtxR family Mn-dependent transcriptional regulator